jgi:hypothetical protein
MLSEPLLPHVFEELPYALDCIDVTAIMDLIFDP